MMLGREELLGIISNLPTQKIVNMLSTQGINIRPDMVDATDAIAMDDETNPNKVLPGWNDSPVTIKGTGERPQLLNKAKIMEIGRPERVESGMMMSPSSDDEIIMNEVAM